MYGYCDEVHRQPTVPVHGMGDKGAERERERGRERERESRLLGARPRNDTEVDS